jgi:hypothetical protein
MYDCRNRARRMIELRYSNSGVNIEGASEELLAIQARILGLADVGVGQIEVTGDSGVSPSPYDLLLEKLVISCGSGPIRASVSARREFNITANQECLRVLASFFSVPKGAEAGWHTHLEFYPENDWIAEDSEPTVISLRKTLG